MSHDIEQHNTAPSATRRTVLTGAAWSVPVIAAASIAPMASASQGQLTVDIQGADIAAGGSRPVVVNLKNAGGQPWAGQVVTLSVGSIPAGMSLDDTTGVTDGSGQFTTTLRAAATVANGATVTVTVTAASLTATDTTTVSGGLTLTLTSANTRLTAGSASGFTATLKNAAGAGVSGQTLTFSVSDVTGTFSSVSGTTNSAGQVSSNLTTDKWTTPGATATVKVTGPGSTTATVSALVLGANAVLIGYNITGAMGTGNTNSYDPLTQPQRVFPSPIKQIVSGGLYDGTDGYFSLFLLEDGTVWGVGRNSKGQLGLGDTNDRLNITMIPNIPKAVQIAAGDDTGYAVLEDGRAMGWGSNGSREIGDGTQTNRTSPVFITGLGDQVAEIAAGAMGALARMKDKTVRAWGSNSNGQVGDGSTTPRATPVALSLTGVEQIVAGQVSSYARLSSGELRAWGDNGYGQLGIGSTSQSNSPAAVTGLTGAVAEIASAYRTVYARIAATGAVMAWGANDSREQGLTHYGMVGNNSNRNVSTPVTVISGGAAKLGASARVAYVQMTDKTFRAWSYNGDRGLGNGNTGGEPWTPVSANSTMPSGRTVTAMTNYSFSSLTTAYVLAP